MHFYSTLESEIQQRRGEIKKGDSIPRNDFWDIIKE